MWGAKVDLKHAYFHLHNSAKLAPYMRINIGPAVYQFDSAVFGLNVLPQLFMSIMKVPQKMWRQQGLLVFVYLGDILILGSTKVQAQRTLDIVLRTLQEAGFVINQKKTSTSPVQTLGHLGFHVDLKAGLLMVPKAKLKSIRKELGKLVTHSHLTPRKMAAILGVIRSFLTAMPCLRAFNSHMLQFIMEHRSLGWDTPVQISWALKQEVLALKDLLHNWTGLPFLPAKTDHILHSDSSQHGWAGVDLTHNSAIQEFWRSAGQLHINVKELFAAVQTIKSFAKPKSTVHLCVDNSVAFSYLHKGGGRKPHLNKLMQDLWAWCLEHKVRITTTLIRSEQCAADALSRTPLDSGDYTLAPEIFQAILHHFSTWIQPEWDMFASPGNHKLPNFCARYPHWEASLVDALHCSLEAVGNCYANPPWNLVSQWLHRLWQHPKIRCLMVVPRWDSISWWPLLIKLRVPHSPVIEVAPRPGLFSNCMGLKMPATRWPLICVLLSGSCWRSNKCLMKTSHFI